MEIIIHTKSSKSEPLLTAINKKIKDGDLKTWEIKKNDKDEILYNHNPDQWSERVLLKPKSHAKGLKLITTKWTKNPEEDEATKGYYIGRFTEILMAHFRDQFTHLETR